MDCDLTDGEGNEQVYSESNALTAIICHASPYYHHLHIHIHFSKWDETKYEKLGNFLLSNFKSTQRIIADSKKELEDMKQLSPDFEPDRDCPQWLAEERDYILSLQSEPTDEKVKINYLEAVEYLEHAKATMYYWQVSTSPGSLGQIGQHQAQANESLEAARSAVKAIEARSSLTLPWTPIPPNELEQQHHLELEKISLPKTVTDLNFLSDIVILWGREDMREKLWFKRHFYDATHAWYKLQRAREEIEIIGLEAHWIWASIHQEEAHLDQVIKDTQLTDPELSKYISLIFESQLNVNLHLHSKLVLLEKQGGTRMLLVAMGNVGRHNASEGADLAGGSISDLLLNDALEESQETVADTAQELNAAVDWEDENKDVDGDNPNYHHVIGRIVNTLENMDLEAM
ncbi:uncharacterized protein EI90DRAFT_3010774 [Cantharellus anzutake]|uniref:uncharacterized protein n=1 Tax=Cantharellus anzutake TaxID=1750568 RepID=UPI001908917C|nr:uncharacterized protein EI90DRAFT_3010774 [Cantharellus anzutake]KAF8343919.1 hypothetical protein EI90DRAFT_3010774 [Cantharellus anzutake]